MTTKCDVLVVGAGPAGCSAAFFLKHFDGEGKLDVELVDILSHEKYGTYHDMCGEAVSAEILSNISPLKPKGVVSKIKLIREFYPGDIEIKTKMGGLLIDRPKFFKSIVDEFVELGGVFSEGVRVSDFSQDDSNVKVNVGDEFKEYDFVVAADGANSLFRRKLGLPGRTKTLIQYVVDKEPEAGTIKFFYDEKYEGDYMWEFPHEGKAKVGYPVIEGRVFKPDGKILLKQARMVGYGGVDKYVNGRILLVGDAACQTNPITEGGIRAGMIAGKLAAKAIADGDPGQYEKEWLKTKFSSKIFNEAFEKLKRMNNKELEKHITPFKDTSLESLISRNILYVKIALFYRRYIKLYQAYEHCNQYGW